jgi:hypothetical protein
LTKVSAAISHTTVGRNILLLGLLCSTAAGAVVHSVGAGQVRYVGGGAAFLDRGTRDGIVAGAKVAVSRRGRQVAECVVDAVADHSAQCLFAAGRAMPARPGDVVRFERVDPVDDPRPPPPTRVPDAELDAARAVVLQAALPPVAYAASRRRAGVAVASRATASVGARAWTTLGGTDTTYVRPWLDAGVRRALPLVAGSYVSSSIRVVGDAVASARDRFRPASPAEIYVWDAAVGIAAGAGPLVATLGRFRPTKAPGATIIDGALVGFAGFGGALEIGAYAGTIPDLVSLAPSGDRITTGAYFGLDAAPTRALMLLPRLRVGLLSSGDFLRTRVEAEAQMQALWANVLSLGASLRLAMPGDTATPTLDGARIDVEATPLSGVRARVGWRALGSYDGELDAGVVVDGTVVPPIRGAQHGDAGVWWTAAPWIVLGGTGGVAVDAATSSVRGFVGPEVALPVLFGDVGGVAVGAQEEPGTMWGRSAWLQTHVRPLGANVPLLWGTRFSWFEHETAYRSPTVLDGVLREALVMMFVDAPILPGLAVRGRAQSLFDLADRDGFGATPTGLFVDVGVSGAL